MKMLRIITALFIATMSASALAGAVYEYSIDTPPGSANAGDVKNVTTSYNTMTEEFSWSYTIGRDGMDNLSDAFWLVVTDGENPKDDADEYAILYGDVDGNVISAYEYSGLNNANSFITPGNLLDSFVGLSAVDDDNGTANIDDDLRTISFTIDASVINAGNADTDPLIWKGLNFGEKLGIWFHPSSNSTFAYNGAGEMTSYTYSKQGWFDASNQTTTQVPEPSGLLLIGLGLLGLGLLRRTRTAPVRANAIAMPA